MNIYEQAQTLIENKPQWTSGEQVQLAKCNDKLVFIRNGGKDSGNLYLVYQNGGQPVRVKCGFLSPMRGWVFRLDRDTYARWVARTGHKIKETQPAPRLMCLELRQEWHAAGGI